LGSYVINDMLGALVAWLNLGRLVGGGPGVESHGPYHFGEQLKPFWRVPQLNIATILAVVTFGGMAKYSGEFGGLLLNRRRFWRTFGGG
jgi:hypothetical protein